MDSETGNAAWNFDAAELWIIFNIKEATGNLIDDWKLEEAYWKLRSFRRELDAILVREWKKEINLGLEEADKERREREEKKKKETEKQATDNKLEELSKIREAYNTDKNDAELKNRMWHALEEFYMWLCYLMKRHGLHFREGEDSTFAVLRR